MKTIEQTKMDIKKRQEKKRVEKKYLIDGRYVNPLQNSLAGMGFGGNPKIEHKDTFLITPAPPKKTSWLDSLAAVFR